MRPDLAIMYFEYCLEELPLDEDERACYELAIEVLKQQESVVRELEKLKGDYSECLNGCDGMFCTQCVLDNAIEIVRGGRNE
jgi:hypothetical protein